MSEHHVGVDEVAWKDLQDELGFDPYCSYGFQAVSSRVLGHRPLLLTGAGDDWRGWYVINLLDAGAGRFLARTPEYGGPWLTTGADAGRAAVEFRQQLDDALRSLDVVSEVALLSAWLPHRVEVGAAWSSDPDKDLCVLDLRTLDEGWHALPKGRRSDIARARREAEIRWGPLTPATATRFATSYADAMEQKQAPDRWRLDVEYFVGLAEEPAADVALCEVEGPDGTAMGLFLRSGPLAAYLYATRDGVTPGGPSAVVWTAAEELAAAGTRELLLGGGLDHGPDDPLFRFKRSLATRTVPLLVAARTFDAAGHAEAVAAGRARPLPANAVDAQR